MAPARRAGLGRLLGGAAFSPQPTPLLDLRSAGLQARQLPVLQPVTTTTSAAYGATATAATTTVPPAVETSTIPATYGTHPSSALTTGAVVGITIGSVAGFLLLLAVLHACVHADRLRVVGVAGLFFGDRGGSSSVVEVEETIVGRSTVGSRSYVSASARTQEEEHGHHHHHHHPHRHRHHHHHHGSRRVRPVIVDPPLPRPPPMARVHVDVESRTRRTRRQPAVTSESELDDEIIVEEEHDSSHDDEIVVEEEHSGSSDEDEVVVIEENSDLSRRHSRRNRRGR